MSEATQRPSNFAPTRPDSGGRARFDDRIDIDTDIGNRESMALIARSLVLLRQVKPLLAGKVLLSALALVPGLTLPFASKIVVDQVLLGKHVEESGVPFPPHFAPFVDVVRDMPPMSTMAAVIALLAALLVLFGRGGTGIWLGGGADTATTSEAKLNAGGSSASGVLGVLETYIDIRLHQRLANTLRTRLFSRLTRLGMTRLDDHRIGDSVYRVMYDAPEVPQICLGLTLQPLFVIVGVILSLYLIQYSYGAVSPGLVWVAALLVPLGLAVTLPASRLMRRVQQASRAAGTSTTNAIEESMSNVQAVQSLGGLARERSRIEAKSRESYRRFRHVKLAEIGVSSLSFTLTIGLGLYVYVTVSGQIVAGVMTPGDWGVLFGLALSIGGAGLSVGMIWINLQANAAAVRRVFFFLDIDAEDDRAGFNDLPAIRERIDFRGVGLCYANGHRALDRIDLSFRFGEFVAIVGPTGSGKTSLAYMIPGFYRPTEGAVLIDGRDIAYVNLRSLRTQVSYVFQEHLLMSDSVRDNFRLVNPTATDEDIWKACETAGASGFLDALPGGLDTVLGRAGDTLSVGQKQRLCIARGLVRNTPVLILDEPTSALDPETEQELVTALRRAAGERLAIVIAHRVSTIRAADRIVFLEDGRVEAVGNHDELMAHTSGRYRRFVALQDGTPV